MWGDIRSSGSENRDGVKTGRAKEKSPGIHAARLISHAQCFPPSKGDSLLLIASCQSLPCVSVLLVSHNLH